MMLQSERACLSKGYGDHAPIRHIPAIAKVTVTKVNRTLTMLVFEQEFFFRNMKRVNLPEDPLSLTILE